ncbi:MAG: STAS domain-containing protein [Victivallales bacterium]|nr:STAS domain-containing protein [Victivallales bacterium]
MGNGKTFIFIVEERLDSSNADKFKSEIENYINGGGTALVIDFNKTRFIDSIGLGALVSILKLTNQKATKVALCALSTQVRQIFELTRLYRLFDIYDTRDEARAATTK